MDSTQEGNHRIAGRYLLLAPIGGGTGQVWAARDEVLGREVAVKRLDPPVAPERPGDRGGTQARVAARIVSLHVVQTFDVVEDGGRSWIVMERIPGQSLRSVLAERGPLATAEVVRLGQHLVLGLTAAHAHGVHHRNLTPSNVLLRTDGSAVLTDLGLSSADGDAATDLWSLGCTLYAAAYGVAPFPPGDLEASGAANRHEELVLPAGPLSPVLRGLLARNPALRISTETARLMLLAAAAGVASARTPPPPPLESVPPAGNGRHRRRRRGRVLAVAAVALVAVGATAAVVLADNAQVVQQAGRTAPVTAVPSTSPAGTPAPTPVPVEPPPASNPATAVPAGFRLHVDETGFTVAVPAGWTVSREGSRIDFVEPDGGRFLRIDQTQTPKPDPVADWQAQEAGVSARLGGYSRIRIEPVAYRNYDAADWEFTWRADSGDLHVLNRNTITGPDRAYAIYWSTPDGVWTDSLLLFQVITDSFVPAT